MDAAPARHGVALVVGDDPSRPFQTLEMTADFTYVRFHYGHQARAARSYTTRARDWARAHAPVAQDSRRLRVLQQRLGGLRPRNARGLARLGLGLDRGEPELLREVEARLAIGPGSVTSPPSTAYDEPVT